MHVGYNSTMNDDEQTVVQVNTSEQSNTDRIEQREYKWAYSQDWVFVFLLSTIMYVEWHKISVALVSQDQSVVMASAVAVAVMVASMLFLLGNMLMRHHVYYVVRINGNGLSFGHETDRIPSIPKNKLKHVNRADVEKAWVSMEKKAVFLKLKDGSEHRISLYRIKPWQLEGLKLEIEAMAGQHRV